MSRIAIPAIESPTADTCAQVKKITGDRVPNTFAATGHLARPLWPRIKLLVSATTDIDFSPVE